VTAPRVTPNPGRGLRVATRARSFMRRIRSPGPGEHVILEPTTRGRGTSSRGGFVSVRLEVPRQFAGDADVRKLLDLIRTEVGKRLRGRSTAELSDEWLLAAISGSATTATAAIELTSRNGAAYLKRNAQRVLDEVIPQVVREWLAEAVPQSGDGVGTEPRANTGGGPLPR
jgi:hypothetical protein